MTTIVARSVTAAVALLLAGALFSLRPVLGGPGVDTDPDAGRASWQVQWQTSALSDEQALRYLRITVWLNDVESVQPLNGLADRTKQGDWSTLQRGVIGYKRGDRLKVQITVTNSLLNVPVRAALLIGETVAPCNPANPPPPAGINRAKCQYGP